MTKLRNEGFHLDAEETAMLVVTVDMQVETIAETLRLAPMLGYRPDPVLAEQLRRLKGIQAKLRLCRLSRRNPH